MEGAVEMKVTNGSKIRNIMGFALSSMTNSNVRRMTWNGSGNAISKTISCVEIMKREITGLHQITQIGFLREPTLEGSDTLKLKTNVPSISILLSKDPLDSSNTGYQAPGTKDVVWAGVSEQSQIRRTAPKRKPMWSTRDIKDGSKARRKQASNNKSGLSVKALDGLNVRDLITNVGSSRLVPDLRLLLLPPLQAHLPLHAEAKKGKVRRI